MDFDDWNTKGRKKYELSLQNRCFNSTMKDSKLKNLGRSDSGISINKKSNNVTSDSSDSENFNLRVSDSFVVDDTHDERNIENSSETNNPTYEKDDVIVISDSSGEDSYSPSLFTKRKQIVGTSNKSDSILSLNITDDDENIYTGPLKQSHDSEKFPSSNYSIQFSSDNSNLKLKMPNNQYNTPTNRIISQVSSNSTINKYRNITENSSASTKNGNKGRINSPNSLKLNGALTPLTRKDLKLIKKNIDSQRAVYESPKWTRREIIDETDTDSDEDIDDIERKKKLIHPALIDETVSEQTSIDDQRTPICKPQKIHGKKPLDSSIQIHPQPTLSDRKKKDISHWLMTNVDNKTNDSVSNVSPSTKNSPESGHSSLDRLELDYETPNNRDKFRSHLNSGGSSTIKKQPKQTLMDSFMKKKKPILEEKKAYTPISISKNTAPTTYPTKVTNNTDLMDCDEILDKLYGTAWRGNKVQYPVSSQPRKANVNVRSTGVQTERRKKVVPKSPETTSYSSNSTDEDRDLLLRRGRYLNNFKNPDDKINKNKKDNFINDSSDDSGGGETTYLTAFTNPRISIEDKVNVNTPISATTIRAIEICDSDTDEEKTTRKNTIHDKRSKDNRRKLSFTDDDNASSDTSEYDPYDIIPPKIIPKPKVTSKKQNQKSTPMPSTLSKKKSFLESLSASISMENSHPDAKRYKLNFKNTKEDLCKHLYKLYNEKIFGNQLPHDMPIEWNNRMRGTAGYCYNRKTFKAIGGITRSSRIVLATKILDSPDRLRDTLVHEMCHAAAWLVNQVSDGHGPFWKTWASKAMKAFPEIPPIRRCHDYKISTKFTYRCTSCGYSIGRHSKSLDISRKRCGHCYGTFELLINKVTKTGQKVQKQSVKEPTGFALFVKQNYQSVRKERQGVAHKEVMQILGQQFSAIKISKKQNDKDDDDLIDNNSN